MPERLHASTLQCSAHGALYSVQREINRGIQRNIALLEYDAWQPTQDNLDAAYAIDASARAVRVLATKADPLDRSRKLPKPPCELGPHVNPVFGPELAFRSANVDGELRHLERPVGSCAPGDDSFAGYRVNEQSTAPRVGLNSIHAVPPSGDRCSTGA
jgi:hypothetical protein